ncbi:MAG: hypothetical protein A2284_15975 [Deltaproteobacteria bacterium RIFOXYA12_FULL_61_11]|nr:MAG: hypothetical protein A2284_15975 [Deltaproteobacteria bacterium RIFOXYA12_FULL_61_11]
MNGRIGLVVIAVLWVGFAQAQTTAPAAPAAPAQDPISLKPSIGVGLERSFKSNNFNASPGLGVSTTLKTGSGYDLKVSTSWTFTYQEYLAEDPTPSTPDQRDFKNAFKGSLKLGVTDLISLSLGGSISFFRINSFDEVPYTWTDTNAFNLNTSTSIQALENLSIDVRVAYTALDWINTQLDAEPIGEGSPTGKDSIEFIGDRGVISQSIFADPGFGGYSGDSTYVQASQVVPATGSVIDHVLDFSPSASFDLPDGTSLSGGYTLTKRISDNIKRDKWGNTFDAGVSKGFWEGGSTDLGYSLSVTNFDNIEADDTYFRRDFYHEFSVELGQELHTNLSVSTGFLWHLNFSNMDGRNYNEQTMYLSLSSSF